MRKNKMAKRFSIASLCLAAAFSAFSGTALLENEVAYAMGNKNGDPFSIVTANTLGTTLSYDEEIYWQDIRENPVVYELCEPVGGVRISSDQPYEEQLVNTFKGDTTIKFTFPEQFDWENKWYGGDFKVRVTDVNDETNYFDVVYYPQVKEQSNTSKYPSGYSNCMTNMAISYNGMVRAISANRDKIDTDYSMDAVIVAPSFLTHYQKSSTQPNGMSMTPGKLTFQWDDDGVLSVLTNSCAVGNGTTQYVVASFDGSYDETAEDNGINWDKKAKTGTYGLPKLSFKNGYKISFLSDFSIPGVDDHATDVCIKEITTNGTTTKFTNRNTVTINILDRSNAYKRVEVGDELLIPVAVYGDNQEVIDVQVVLPSGKRNNVTPGQNYKVKDKGVHHVIYCVQEDATNESLAGFSFTAQDWTTIETTDFVHTPASVKQSKNGLRISSDNAYTATLKSIFTGNVQVDFKFPETYVDDYYGDFTFRITDAKNDSNYFDIKYYVSNSRKNYTGVYVQYGDNVRVAHSNGLAWYDVIPVTTEAIAYAPSFLSYCGGTGEHEGGRMGTLSLVWDNDVLSVLANTSLDSDESIMRVIAKFDGTNVFANNGTSFGLPKLNFANGYTISVSSASGATDVLFSAIETDNATYDFSQTELAKDSNVEAFDNAFKALDTVQTIKGKVFLGWKNTTTNELYPAYSIVKRVAGQSYEPIVMIFDTVNGASIRLDTSENGKSGIRFQTYFNVDEYEELKGYIQSFGTLVAHTDALTEIDFTIESDQGESVVKVQNAKGTFEYTAGDGEKYTAYSMAVVDLIDYASAFSARGYLVVKYADGTTQNVYTDFNVADNSGCVADMAYQIKENNPDLYAIMTKAQQAIIDAYANAYAK